VLACGESATPLPRAEPSPRAERSRAVDPSPQGEARVTPLDVETENQRELLLVRGSHLGLELVRTDGTHVRWLTTTAAYEPRVTADGTAFYRASDERSWMRFDPETSLETRVVAPPEVVVEPRATPPSCCEP
jgi:hypothetical protein